MVGIAAEVTDEAERQSWATAILEHLGMSPTGDDDEPHHLFKIGILTASFAKIENDDWFPALLARRRRGMTPASALEWGTPLPGAAWEVERW